MVTLATLNVLNYARMFFNYAQMFFKRTVVVMTTSLILKVIRFFPLTEAENFIVMGLSLNGLKGRKYFSHLAH